MKTRLFFSILAAAAVLCLAIGCGGSSGGDDSNDIIGAWKCISWEGGPDSGFYWHFLEDGTCTLNSSPTDASGVRRATYSVSGNRITGSGQNGTTGAFDIDFVVDGDTFTGEFIEHWHSPYKHVEVIAVKQ